MHLLARRALGETHARLNTRHMQKLARLSLRDVHATFCSIVGVSRSPTLEQRAVSKPDDAEVVVIQR
jgi:hypothetical protein